nr:MAG TPA: hypothetical protein [Caudoviricetes sp.]
MFTIHLHLSFPSPPHPLFYSIYILAYKFIY